MLPVRLRLNGNFPGDACLRVLERNLNVHNYRTMIRKNNICYARRILCDISVRWILENSRNASRHRGAFYYFPLFRKFLNFLRAIGRATMSNNLLRNPENFVYFSLAVSFLEIFAISHFSENFPFLSVPLLGRR